MLRGAMSARRALRLGACIGLATSSVSALTLSQPKQLKITYFNIQGPAEPARLALVIGGVAFEDERLNRDEMMALREAGKLPWGQLPLCTVDGSTVFAQSPAIATYCAKLAGLYPEDPIAAARVDEIVHFLNQDVRERCIAPTMREPDPEKKKALRAELQETKLPEKFAMLEKRLEKTKFLCGDELTLADLSVYVMLNWVGMGVLDGVNKDCILKFPKLTNLVRTINEMPEVKAWNAEKNPKLNWVS